MPLVTVSEVQRFALPPGSSVIAGAAGLGRSVGWVRLLRARPATLQAVEPGEVWLLSPGAVHAAGDARALARLVREVAEAGVVGYFVLDRLPDEALSEADAAATPVILLPPDTALAEVEKEVMALAVDRERAISQRVQQVYDRLLATLVEDRGAELLADIVHEVTTKAFYLLDEHFQATVGSGGDERTAEALQQLRRRFWEGQIAESDLQERLLTVRLPHGPPLAALIRPLLLRGAVEGYLALLGPRDDFGEYDYQVAHRATSVLAIELAKQSAVVEARLRVQGDFLGDLFDNPAPAMEPLVARARSLGYDLTGDHLVFVLRPADAGEGAAAVRQQQRFVDVARRRLVLDNVGSLLRDLNGTIQALAPCPADLDPHRYDAIVAWVEGIRAELQEALAPDAVSVAAGVGRSPDSRLSHHLALREALQAAEIASTLAGGGATLHFAQLGALRLIFQLAENPELTAFQEDVLGPLEEYDRQHRSDFVQTLAAFFDAGGNHMRAARELHIHRNTLIYRLDRIRDVLGGASLEDPDTRLNLQLALKIRQALTTRAG